MPAKGSGKELTESEKQLLRRWIEQGADWQGHWLFQPIGRPEPPPIDSALASFRRNDVDNFVLAALKEHTLKPSAEADRATRRRSTGCSGRRIMASAWPSGGSTWSVTQTASDITVISP
jgi:hypothetical protein